jgi:hypothetical protein
MQATIIRKMFQSKHFLTFDPGQLHVFKSSMCWLGTNRQFIWDQIIHQCFIKGLGLVFPHNMTTLLDDMQAAVF